MNSSSSCDDFDDGLCEHSASATTKYIKRAAQQSGIQIVCRMQGKSRTISGGKQQRRNQLHLGKLLVV